MNLMDFRELTGEFCTVHLNGDVLSRHDHDGMPLMAFRVCATNSCTCRPYSIEEGSGLRKVMVLMVHRCPHWNFQDGIFTFIFSTLESTQGASLCEKPQKSNVHRKVLRTFNGYR